MYQKSLFAAALPAELQALVGAHGLDPQYATILEAAGLDGNGQAAAIQRLIGKSRPTPAWFIAQCQDLAAPAERTGGAQLSMF